jgi:hypothetical protein
MTEGDTVHKWMVEQFYISGQRRVRVYALSREGYEAYLKEVGLQPPRRCVFREVADGAIELLDFFDDEGGAREFAERCWNQYF